jgi:hypothetical protein
VGVLEPPTLSTGEDFSNGQQQHRITIGANTSGDLSSFSSLGDVDISKDDGHSGTNEALSAAVEGQFEALCELVIPGIIRPCLSALSDLLPPVIPVR